MKEKQICSLYDCNNDLDEDSLVFTHRDQHDYGGICTACLGDSTKIKVIFEKNSKGLLWPMEMIQLDKKLS